LYWIAVHKEDEILVDNGNDELKPEQACKHILGKKKQN